MLIPFVILSQMSEKEAVSQSVDSPGTDLVVSSSHNGPLTSGTGNVKILVLISRADEPLL